MQRQDALFAVHRDAGAECSTASVCRLDEPLWPKGPNLRKLTQLCVKVSVACERASREAGARQSSSSHPPTPFDGPRGAALYRDFERVCRGPPLHTLRAVGLLALFPRLEGLAQAGARPQQQSHRQWQRLDGHAPEDAHGGVRSPGWDYFTHVSHLHQLLRMATQLHADASNVHNHKYLAHQIALLYQCVNQVRGESKPFKKRIEEQFDAVKHETEAPGPGAPAAALPPHLRAWLKEVTQEVAALVTAFPPGLTEKLHPLLRVLSSEQRQTSM